MVCHGAGLDLQCSGELAAGPWWLGLEICPSHLMQLLPTRVEGVGANRGLNIMSRWTRDGGLQGAAEEKSTCVSEILASYRAEDSGCSLRVVFIVHICWPMCHLVASAKQETVVCYIRVTGCALVQQKSEASKHDASNRQNQANFNSCLLQAIACIKEAL